ncbi:MAG TPA: hypothetical protein VHP82_04490 [Gaiellaceae bacterium]|nr:hypothetical protein [Gaiellaceae bacterium]
MHLELERDTAKAFPEVAQPDSIETARVWHCKYRTLEPLRELKNLRALEVATYPDESLEPISRLPGLTYLRILHLPKVRDLAPLVSLTSLTTLCLETLPSWDASGKRTVVTSLEPLTSLDALRHIQLFSVVPPDRSLEPLERMPWLETARLQGFLKAEIRRFFEATGVANEFAPGPYRRQTLGNGRREPCAGSIPAASIRENPRCEGRTLCTTQRCAERQLNPPRSQQMFRDPACRTRTGDLRISRPGRNRPR